LQIDSEMVPEIPEARGHTMRRTRAASPKPIRRSLVVPRSSVRARRIARPIWRWPSALPGSLVSQGSATEPDH